MRLRFTQLARQLRQSDNEAEQRLWSRLRGKQLLDTKWRRQETIGKYIVDFVCLSHKLIVEVDGGQHAEPAQAAYDALRTAFLTNAGFRVVRVWSHEVLTDLDAVLTMLAQILAREQ